MAKWVTAASIDKHKNTPGNGVQNNYNISMHDSANGGGKWQGAWNPTSI